MDTFEITLSDDSEPHVVAADAYELEGPMTTFFSTESSHVRLDSWAVRLASFRSADICMIRRVTGHPRGLADRRAKRALSA